MVKDWNLKYNNFQKKRGLLFFQKVYLTTVKWKEKTLDGATSLF